MVGSMHYYGQTDNFSHDYIIVNKINNHYKGLLNKWNTKLKTYLNDITKAFICIIYCMLWYNLEQLKECLDRDRVLQYKLMF